MTMTELPFVCPRCGAKSYNLNDLRERYCGRCHVFVDDPTLDGFSSDSNSKIRQNRSVLSAYDYNWQDQKARELL
jgi:hypothetical protein